MRFVVDEEINGTAQCLEPLCAYVIQLAQRMTDVVDGEHANA